MTDDNKKFGYIELDNYKKKIQANANLLSESSYQKLLKICKNDEFESTLDADNKGYYLKDGFLYANEDYISSLDINDKKNIADDMTECLYQDLLLKPRTGKSLIEDYKNSDYNSAKIISVLTAMPSESKPDKKDLNSLLYEIKSGWSQLFKIESNTISDPNIDKKSKTIDFTVTDDTKQYGIMITLGLEKCDNIIKTAMSKVAENKTFYELIKEQNSTLYNLNWYKSEQNKSVLGKTKQNITLSPLEKTTLIYMLGKIKTEYAKELNALKTLSDKNKININTMDVKKGFLNTVVDIISDNLSNITDQDINTINNNINSYQPNLVQTLVPYTTMPEKINMPDENFKDNNNFLTSLKNKIQHNEDQYQQHNPGNIMTEIAKCFKYIKDPEHNMISKNDANTVFDFVVKKMNISEAKDKILLTDDLKNDVMIANQKYITFGKLCEILEKNDQTKEYYADILIENPVDKIISDKSKQI